MVDGRMTGETWEAGARDAANRVLEDWGTYSADEWQADPQVLLEFLRAGELVDEHWSELCDIALVGYCKLSGFTRHVALSMLVDTLISKQHDYGHDNILWGGREGLVIRAHDKWARIQNLERRVSAANESLEDSWLDLAGYSLLGMMLETGTFERPLSADILARDVAFTDLGDMDPVPLLDDVAFVSTLEHREQHIVISATFAEHPDCDGWFQYDLIHDGAPYFPEKVGGVGVGFSEDGSGKVIVGGFNDIGYDDIALDEWGFGEIRGTWLEPDEVLGLIAVLQCALAAVTDNRAPAGSSSTPTTAELHRVDL